MSAVAGESRNSDSSFHRLLPDASLVDSLTWNLGTFQQTIVISKGELSPYLTTFLTCVFEKARKDLTFWKCTRTRSHAFACTLQSFDDGGC